MNKIIILILCLCCAFTIARAEEGPALNPSDANIVGHVVDRKTGEHLSFITIFLKGTTIGTSTDGTGHYYLKNLPEGEFTVVMKTMGYKTIETPVMLKKGRTLEINFEVEEEALSLDGVVVSANRNEVSRKAAPVVVNVMSAKLFETVNSTDRAGFENVRDDACHFACRRAELPAGRAGGKQLPELRFPTGAYQWTGRSLHADIGG